MRYLCVYLIAMYRQMITPLNTKLTLQLPSEFVGRLVEVIAFPVDENNGAEDSDSWETAKKFFDAHRVSFQGQKFNRDEANER